MPEMTVAFPGAAFAAATEEFELLAGLELEVELPALALEEPALALEDALEALLPADSAVAENGFCPPEPQPTIVAIANAATPNLTRTLEVKPTGTSRESISNCLNSR